MWSAAHDCKKSIDLMFMLGLKTMDQLAMVKSVCWYVIIIIIMFM